MREGIEQPDTVVDVTGLPLDTVEDLPGGGLRIGALVRNSTLAADRRVRSRYPVLSQALLSGASGQLRNMATVGGNLLQRTRCLYFYDLASACNKREPGTVVEIQGAAGSRRVDMADLHRLPGDTPEVETNLGPGDLIIAVELPPPLIAHSRYRKVRDRASYAFALVSVAAALQVSDQTVTEVRLALGGVATKPWRAREAERRLVGGPADEAAFRRAAEAELAPATVRHGNAFKVALAASTIVAVLRELNSEGAT
jgi:xanthine dehydrogenase YagS FAD-binding subunit